MKNKFEKPESIVIQFDEDMLTGLGPSGGGSSDDGPIEGEDDD